MAELTVDQQKAVAIARARRQRASQQQPAEDLDAIRLVQAAKFPTREKFGVESGENMTGVETGIDQLKANLVGALQLPETVGKAALGAYKGGVNLTADIVKNSLAGDPAAVWRRLMQGGTDLAGAVKGAVEPARTLGRNAVALSEALGGQPGGTSVTDPTAEENRGMAEASGANAMGVAVPVLAAKVGEKIPTAREVGRMITDPEALRARAATNRAAVAATRNGQSSIPTSKTGVVLKAVQKASNPVRRAFARMEEGAADFLEGTPAQRAATQTRMDAAWRARGNVDDVIDQGPTGSVPQRPAVSRDAMGQPVEPWLDDLRSVETPEQAFRRIRAMQDDQAGMSRAPLEAGGTRSLPTPGELETGVAPKNPLPAPGQKPMTSADLNKWMNVRENQLLYGKNPGERILAENLLGPDKQTTLQNVIAARKAVGSQMDEAFKRAESGEPISPKPLSLPDGVTIKNAFRRGVGTERAIPTSQVPEGTYYHVVPEGADISSGLKSFDRLKAEGRAPRLKWEQQIDSNRISLFDNKIEAENFISDFEPRGKIVEVNVPKHPQGKFVQNSEGYLSVDDAIPPEWLAPRKGVRFELESDIQSAIADAKKTIGKSTDEAFMRAIEGIESEIVSRTDDLKNMTPSAAHELEVELGRGVKWTGASSDVQRLLKDIRGRISKKLKTIDGIIPLKERWGDLFEGEQALKSSIRKDNIGRGTGSLPQK